MGAVGNWVGLRDANKENGGGMEGNDDASGGVVVAGVVAIEKLEKLEVGVVVLMLLL